MDTVRNESDIVLLSRFAFAVNARKDRPLNDGTTARSPIQQTELRTKYQLRTAHELLLWQRIPLKNRGQSHTCPEDKDVHVPLFRQLSRAQFTGARVVGAEVVTDAVVEASLVGILVVAPSVVGVMVVDS